MDNVQKKKNLKQWFGYDDFKDSNQERIVNNLLDGNDVIAVMPTGSGKSLCYQYTAAYYYFEKSFKTTIVVEPLIALMNDQIDSLEEIGKNVKEKYKIPAAMFSSEGCRDVNVTGSRKANRAHEIYKRAVNREYAIIYVSPERLISREFIEKISGIDISMICIDEAHCISLWSFDFRQSYLNIPQFIEQQKERPQIAAFTATASKQIERDIQLILKMKPEERKRGKGQITYTLPENCVDYKRDNLDLYIQKVEIETQTKEETDEEYEERQFLTKSKEIIKLLNKEEFKSKDGIIYFTEIGDLKKFYAELDASDKNGHDQKFGDVSLLKFFSKVPYNEPPEAHRAEKKEAYAKFTEKDDKAQLMLATDAFGMGIDKEDIGYVIHFSPPADIETYYQEVGRAGRGGKYSCPCILFYTNEDIKKLRNHIESWEEPENSIYPKIGSWLSDVNLELDIFKSFFDKKRFNNMVNFLHPKKDAKNGWYNMGPMDRIVDYFKHPDEIADRYEFWGYCWDIFNKLKNYQDPLYMQEFLEPRNLEGWGSRLVKDLKTFDKMLREDIGAKDVGEKKWEKALSSPKDDDFKGLMQKLGGRAPTTEIWEKNLIAKFPEIQKHKNCFIYNDTKLAKNLRQGRTAKRTDKEGWYRIKINKEQRPKKNNQKNTGNEPKSEPAYTFYYIVDKKGRKYPKFTFFDMMVADAVYTIWSQEEQDKIISVHEILERLTGDVDGHGKYDARSRICKEIGKSLDKMSQDIFICFPTYNDGSLMIRCKYEECGQKLDDQVEFRPFLPLTPYKQNDKEDDIFSYSYKMNDIPLLYKYAESMRELGTIHSNQLEVTGKDSKKLRQNFQNINIQVYITEHINTYHRIIFNYRDTSVGGKKAREKGIGHINLYRRTHCIVDEDSYKIFLCEQLQLAMDSKKERSNLREKVEYIMEYETYMGFIQEYWWGHPNGEDIEETEKEDNIVNFKMYDPNLPERKPM